MSFFIAMLNRRATASFLHPQSIISEHSEFLIVTRSGGRNEFLSISNAGACTGQEPEAPIGLKPDLVIHATLVSQGPNLEDIFVVERDISDRIKGIGIEGSSHHLGGDGYLVLTQSTTNLALRGSIRLRPGPETSLAEARCILLRQGEPGVTIHLDACYLPWTRELLPSSFSRAVGGAQGLMQ